MFANSLALVEACDLPHLHVFPYSPRPETPAARMPQIPRALVKDRAAQLRAAGEACLTRFLTSEIGKTRTVLVEKPGLARSEQFALVELRDTGPETGQLIAVEITRSADGRLSGQPARRAA
jgi:threonylcarbamoyladenosine tRNA methylthiotransferase MtaB